MTFNTTILKFLVIYNTQNKIFLVEFFVVIWAHCARDLVDVRRAHLPYDCPLSTAYGPDCHHDVRLLSRSHGFRALHKDLFYLSVTLHTSPNGPKSQVSMLVSHWSKGHFPTLTNNESKQTPRSLG